MTGMLELRTYSDTAQYNIGDVILKNDIMWIFTGNTFVELGPITDTTAQPTYTTAQPAYRVITQCRNCGAPTDKYGECHYCGTINRIMER